MQLNVVKMWEMAILFFALDKFLSNTEIYFNTLKVNNDPVIAR